MKPGYLDLYHSGELDERIDRLHRVLESCTLCPRACGVNRLAGGTGYCGAGAQAVVSSLHPHFGEEDPLVGPLRFAGIGGSGTIFLAHCNLGCIYCQNSDISHLGQGHPVTAETLAAGMLELQNRGCHNINFVTPTHFVPQIVTALKPAIAGGLTVPLVYNCGGYENAQTIRQINGIFDIYMPDIKYGDDRSAERYSNAPDYFARCRESVLEMHRQVGTLQLDESGIAGRGLLVRHLVLPNGLAGSEAVLRFVAEEISTDTYLNIMGQYRPMFKAGDYPELNRRPTGGEMQAVIGMARRMGLHRGLG